MKVTRKIMSFLIPLPLILPLSACSFPEGQVKVILPTDSAQMQQSSSVERRFLQSAPQAPTVVESAIELSEKYVRLSEQMAAQRQKNQDIIAENRRFEDRLPALEAQLQQTQKELTEANDLLIEMRIELNNWKVDILGFRDEMRDADTAQLKTLLEILKVLGGEVKSESAQDEQAGSNAVSAREPGQPRTVDN